MNMKLTQYYKEKQNIIAVVITIIIGFSIYCLFFTSTKEKPINFDKETIGKITIYNNYSTTTQRLIYNTRVQSKIGNIYRTKNSVEVPGYIMIDNKIISGSSSVDIYSDIVNDKIKTDDIGNFKIPAFVGDPRYESIYGKL